MVNLTTTYLRLVLLATLSWLFSASPGLAMLSQTASDLQVLEDALRQATEADPSLLQQATPMLLAPPLHHWRESRDDFAAAALATLTTIFSTPQAIIPCPDCDAWRLNVRPGNGLDIYNGELSLGELGRLQRDHRYSAAKALTVIQETPSGVQVRITSLTDGRLIWSRLADSSERLDQVKPWTNFAAERDRRLRGESLSYVFINLGLYPNPLFQLEFIEQWGDRNQHLSGVAISLLNPNASVGVVYHYMMPKLRRLHLGGSLYFPLQNLAQSSGSSRDVSSQFVGQGMVEYTFANSYGMFGSVSSKGQFSIGFNFYNPLFMPFLL